MRIRIFQINEEKDKNRVLFMGFESLPLCQGTSEPDSEIYDKVFDGDVERSSLEGVYEMFNRAHPEEYRGRSLSVSDVVEVISSPNEEAGFYFCDHFGFKKTHFGHSKSKCKSR